MRALVVFESMYGNTCEIAAAVAEGLRAHLPVDLVEVIAAPAGLADDVALLVIGGPTHAHGMSKPDTRASAAARDREHEVPFQLGIREWLAGFDASSGPGAAAASDVPGAGDPLPGQVAAAAFDTRIKGPGLLWGSAARDAMGELQRLGFRVAAPPVSFLVQGPLGPVRDILLDGEVDRARTWGTLLGSEIVAPS